MTTNTPGDDLRNLPDPSRLIYGLRDTGYDFNTAAADIIDNAIAANATEVNVQVELQQDGRKFVYFGDNGDGMDADGLFSAMRYGAPKRASAKSLGKFGLGLKTASSSICLRYGLLSRSTPGAPLGKLEWDLEHVEDINDWKMLQEPVTAMEQHWYDELCGEDSGTLVVWSKCDRLLSRDYLDAGGAQERRAVRNRIDRLKEHLALVFHRYLEPADTTYPTVKITVNGEQVAPWNPFFPEKAEQVLPDHARILKIQLEDGSVHEARMNAWILPHSKDLSKEENEQKARISSRAQGFYIHREGRIIHNGGWLGVFRSDDPHYSLLRVEFDFDHQLDDAFKIDVKKSRILFDPALEESLRKTLTPFWNEADSRYRRRNREAASDVAINHGSSNKTIAKVSPKAAAVVGVDADAQEVTVNNNRGAGIRLHIPVNNNVDPERIFIEAVDDITSGHVWEPAMRSVGSSGHRIGVRINRHHDFFQKIYLRAAALGDAVEGIDFLLWAFAAAEQNNSDPELANMFEDIREEISGNLRRLLKDTPAPSARDLEEIAEAVAEGGADA
ncbi:MAG: hypothetical protein ACI8U3_001272 [Brevundimonas sp.]|jgi:hypothetical protein|uniref:ATP-binding protein n=1 Tax=Brevundimonas sp. TaxID=1871086 RepID=UPI0039E2D450